MAILGFQGLAFSIFNLLVVFNLLRGLVPLLDGGWIFLVAVIGVWLFLMLGRGCVFGAFVEDFGGTRF